jgi:prepilin-type N-terminal cleavage/methylation domain-containing protein
MKRVDSTADVRDQVPPVSGLNALHPRTEPRGFTLIELVVVIALLGVLIAFAVPRFASLQTEARRASVLSMEGVMRSGSTLVHSKARALGLLNGSRTLAIDAGRNIPIVEGYADAHWNNAIRYVLSLDTQSFTGNNNQTCNVDWCGRGNQRSVPTDNGRLNTAGRVAKVWPRGYSWNDLCGVHYVNHRDGRAPVIGASLSGC